jgi:hypothetical protein
MSEESLKPLFTQELLKEIQKANADKWLQFWKVNENKEATK